MSIPQVAINWVLHKPGVDTVILGARNEEQLRDILGGRRVAADAGGVGAPGRGQRAARAVPAVAPAQVRNRAESAAAGAAELTGWLVLLTRSSDVAVAPHGTGTLFERRKLLSWGT